MTRLAPCTRSIAPPIPLTILPGIIQLAMSPVADTCIAPRIAASILPPRIMPKDGRRVEERCAVAKRHRLLAGVDQVWVLVAVIGICADTEDPVLGLQDDFDVVCDVVRYQRRKADAEVDVRTVVEFGSGPGGHLFTRPSHQIRSCRGRTVRFSMRLSSACSAVSSRTR